jgi:hypothetical protein
LRDIESSYARSLAFARFVKKAESLEVPAVIAVCAVWRSNEFVNDLIRHFPIECSVELKRLIDLEMEGSVG